MIVAFLLPFQQREWRLVYGEDFFAAGVVCLVVGLLLTLATWLQKRMKKPRKFAYWRWVFVSCGVAMIILSFVLSAQNPGLDDNVMR